MKLVGAHVRYEAVDGVGWITLTRPEVLNALDAQLATDLAAAVAAAEADPDAWVVVVTGEGRAFSSGMDRRALSTGAIGEPFFRDWIRALNGLEDMGKLVVAAIRGYCIGGGLQLALACDLRLCAADAVLGLGATRHGLIPDGAVLRLGRIVGLGRAKELALLNDHLTPAQSLAMGLVNWVVPAETLDAELRARGRQVPGRGPHGHPPHQAPAPGLVPPGPARADRRGLAAQMECMRGWELLEANQAWDERREARFFPPPPGV